MTTCFRQSLTAAAMAFLIPSTFLPAQDGQPAGEPSPSAELLAEPAASPPHPEIWPEVPGGRRTAVAPAAALFGRQVHAFMVDGDERILFQAYDLDSRRWTMDGYWYEVPGAGITGIALAAASTAERLYVFAVGKEGNVYVNDKLPGGPLEGWGSWWRPLQPGRTDHAVAAAADRNGQVYVFRTSPSNKSHNVYYTTDPLNARTWRLVPRVTSRMAPATVYDEANDSVHLFVVNSSGVFMTTLHEGDWSPPCRIEGAGTDTPVAAAVSDGRLYLFSIRKKRILAQVYGGACGIWSGKTELLGGNTTNTAPVVARGQNGLPFVVFVRGTDQKKEKQRIYYHAFHEDDVVSEVTTRGHFSTSSGRLRRGYSRLGYSVAGRIPGITGGTECPQELAVAVHGWTNPPDAGQDKFQRARASLRHFGYEGPVVGFSWDSDTQGCPVDFPKVPPDACGFDEGKAAADGNGPKLASFLSDFKARCPCTSIHLMGHSLGGRVVLKAIRALAEEPDLRWNGELGEARIDDVHLLGAAVDDRRPRMDDEFGESIQNEVGRLYNYWNSYDQILADYYKVEEGEDALGLKGIEGSRQAPGNYTEVASRYLGTNHYAHWGFRGEDGAVTNPGVMQAVRARFEARSTQCLGYLDPGGCDTIEGWAWDLAHPDEAVDVGLYADGVLLGSLAADTYRSDLEREGIGDGRHGFRHPVPLWLKDGQPHSISVRHGATTFELNGSPASLQCFLEGFLDQVGCQSDFLGQQVVIRGWAWDPSRPDDPISVEIYNHGRFVAVVPADQFRPDLLVAGKGNGRHGFTYAIPTRDPLDFGDNLGRHEIHAMVAGTTLGLALSPRTVVCGSKDPRPEP